ncbi:MAG: hypothetical protein V9G10_02150 [Candidatus Nanopelagicales bacterium]
MSKSPDDPVPYDENAWEQIVADLGDSMPPAEALEPAPEFLDLPEETFEPPEPPPLPRLDVVSRFAWVGTIGGPLLLFAGVLLPGIVGPGLVSLGVVAFVAGFLTLVLRHPNEPEDGWDDGSVV